MQVQHYNFPLAYNNGLTLKAMHAVTMIPDGDHDYVHGTLPNNTSV